MSAEFCVTLAIKMTEDLKTFMSQNKTGIPVEKLHITLAKFKVNKEDVVCPILIKLNQLSNLIKSFTIKTQNVLHVKKTNVVKLELNEISTSKINEVRKIVVKHFEKLSFLKPTDMLCKPHVTLIRECYNEPVITKIRNSISLSTLEILMWNSEKNKEILPLNGTKVFLTGQSKNCF